MNREVMQETIFLHMQQNRIHLFEKILVGYLIVCCLVISVYQIPSFTYYEGIVRVMNEQFVIEVILTSEDVPTFMKQSLFIDDVKYEFEIFKIEMIEHTRYQSVFLSLDFEETWLTPNMVLTLKSNNQKTTIIKQFITIMKRGLKNEGSITN